MKNNIKAVESVTLGSEKNPRYVLIDIETGEILDDAQGYGYKTKRGVYAAYSYKLKSVKGDQLI